MRSHSIGVVRMGRGKFTLVVYSTVLESYLCSFCRFGLWMFINVVFASIFVISILPSPTRRRRRMEGGLYLTPGSPKKLFYGLLYQSGYGLILLNAAVV